MLELSGKMGKSMVFKVPGLTVTMHFIGRLLMRNGGAPDSVLCHRAESWGRAGHKQSVDSQWSCPNGTVTHHSFSWQVVTILNSVSCVSWSVGQRASYMLDTPVLPWDVCVGQCQTLFSFWSWGAWLSKMNKRTCVILVYFHKRGILVWEGLLLLLLRMEQLMLCPLHFMFKS